MSLSSQTSQSRGTSRHGSGTQDTPAAGDECWGKHQVGKKLEMTGGGRTLFQALGQGG